VDDLKLSFPNVLTGNPAQESADSYTFSVPVIVGESAYRAPCRGVVSQRSPEALAKTGEA